MKIKDINKTVWKLYGKDFENFILNGGVKTAILHHCLGDKKDTRWKDFRKSYFEGSEPPKEVKEMMWL